MYSYIKGTIREISDDGIVLENNGIGYRIQVPGRMLSDMPGHGAEVEVHTYLYVREDAFLLFGFSSRDELRMFRLLINVSGIGPRGALSVLSSLSADEIRLAVVGEDVKVISRVPGIGKKTAQRLIIELKDKVSPEDFSDPAPDVSAGAPGEGNSVQREAAEALVALGYAPAEAARVLSGIETPEGSDVEDVLRQALRQLAL